MCRTLGRLNIILLPWNAASAVVCGRSSLANIPETLIFLSTMPKSFLVKKRQKSKDYPTLEENIINEQDEGNIGIAEKTQSLWKHRTNDILKPVLESWPSSTISTGSTVSNIDEDLRSSEKQPKLVSHEKGQLSCQNVILSRSLNAAVEDPTETDEKQCNRCQRIYTTNAALVKHQRYYCNFFQSKSFTCKYCDKVYLSLGALKMHIRTHTLPCRCVICGKSFSRPWLLQGHIRTHTGEKPYECSSCNRAFADRSNLRAHLQTHSDIKKYKCERCSKTFSRMSLLLKHQNACSVLK